MVGFRTGKPLSALSWRYGPTRFLEGVLHSVEDTNAAVILDIGKFIVS